MSSTASKVDSLQGLEGAKRAFSRLIEGRSQTHAVLFYGAPGAGKRTLAGALAQAWLCEKWDRAGEAAGCGECKSCQSFERGAHPDVLTIRPWGPSSLIKIAAFQVTPKPAKDEEEIFPLELFFRSAPIVSQRKVVIVLDAERMNAPAANAFLKKLEEPPSYGRIVLTTASARALPPTILSRCMAIACELPTAPVGDAELFRLAGGSPGRMAQMATRREAYLGIDSLASKLAERTPNDAPKVADEFRTLVEGLEIPGNARTGNTEAVATLAAALQIHHPDRPEWAMQAGEAHRRIVGNGSAAYVFDSLFAAILAS